MSGTTTPPIDPCLSQRQILAQATSSLQASILSLQEQMAIVAANAAAVAAASEALNTCLMNNGQMP